MQLHHNVSIKAKISESNRVAHYLFILFINGPLFIYLLLNMSNINEIKMHLVRQILYIINRFTDI